MKTPREILLARHQGAIPQLDEVRAAAIASLGIDQSPACVGILREAWRELFWSCRHAWTGLAAVWLVIFVLNLESHDPTPALSAKAPPPAPEVIAAFREQRRLLAELIGRAEPIDAEPPKPGAPRPRTELFSRTAMA